MRYNQIGQRNVVSNSRFLIDLEREHKGKFMESKITQFGSRFTEKSKSELDRHFQTQRERNTKLKNKIN